MAVGAKICGKAAVALRGNGYAAATTATELIDNIITGTIIPSIEGSHSEER